ncbi:MAG: penicillin-binding protein 2 [Gemmatimonadota bacterium]
MRTVHPNLRRGRARVALLLLGLVMGLLAVVFFRAQVVRGSAWALQSESNRLRVLPLPSPRGTIFDRYGNVIADNVPSYSVSLFPAPLDSIESGLRRIQPILGFGEERFNRLVEQASADRRQPLLVDADAEYEAVAALEELRGELPGVFLEMRPKRRYMGGAALGHVMGYVGEISGDELERPGFEEYEPRMIIGKDGLERQYEDLLQGSQGVRYVEVDAVGRVVGSFEGQAAAPALPGDDLHLNLDLALMEYIHQIFPDSLQGAVVALDVDDGGILALYSAPSFDPNRFVGGIDSQLWTFLNQDPTRPLFNRAVVGRYPPASTWKVATAAIGLEMGVVDSGEFMPQACNGSFRYGNVVRRCWDSSGHGHLDLAGALANSCNVYFYQLGLRIGLERLVERGTRFGFSEPCGVDLPAESSGIFPGSLDFWQDRFGYRANENEVLSLAIGQGPNDQTPLKMAQFYVALGRDGTAPAPRLARLRGEEEPEIEWSLGLGPESLDALREGLREVTAAGGTAFMSSLEHWDFIGKTGTAQQGLEQDRSHAWFVGLAGPWFEEPEIVIAVIVEEGESGSAMAAPIAAKAADYHLRRKYGIPTDTIQTLREHINAGVSAPWARWNGRPDPPADGSAVEIE